MRAEQHSTEAMIHLRERYAERAIVLLELSDPRIRLLQTLNEASHNTASARSVDAAHDPLQHLVHY